MSEGGGSAGPLLRNWIRLTAQHWNKVYFWIWKTSKCNPPLKKNREKKRNLQNSLEWRASKQVIGGFKCRLLRVVAGTRILRGFDLLLSGFFCRFSFTTTFVQSKLEKLMQTLSVAHPTVVSAFEKPAKALDCVCFLKLMIWNLRFNPGFFF